MTFWQFFEKHQSDIRNFCEKYLSYMEMGIFDRVVKEQNTPAMLTILNDAWFEAPDLNSTRPQKGFIEICDLCDGDYANL